MSVWISTADEVVLQIGTPHTCYLPTIGPKLSYSRHITSKWLTSSVCTQAMLRPAFTCSSQAGATLSACRGGHTHLKHQPDEDNGAEG